MLNLRGTISRQWERQERKVIQGGTRRNTKWCVYPAGLIAQWADCWLFGRCGYSTTQNISGQAVPRNCTSTQPGREEGERIYLPGFLSACFPLVKVCQWGYNQPHNSGLLHSTPSAAISKTNLTPCNTTFQPSWEIENPGLRVRLSMLWTPLKKSSFFDRQKWMDLRGEQSAMEVVPEVECAERVCEMAAPQESEELQKMFLIRWIRFQQYVLPSQALCFILGS